MKTFFVRGTLVSFFWIFSSCQFPTGRSGDFSCLLYEPKLEKSRKEALLESRFSEGKWPDKRWWREFHSEELNQLVEESLKENPTILAVKQRICEAQAKSVIAHAALLPLVYFNGEDVMKHLSYNGVIRALNPEFPRQTNWVDLSLSFTYEFDFWHKYRNQYRAAIAKTLAAVAEAKDVELIISVALVQSYYALKTNMYRKELCKTLLGLQKKLYELDVWMHKKALFSLIPQNITAEQVGETEKLLDTFTMQVVVDKHMVNILRGKNPDEDFAIDDHPLDPPQKMVVPEDLSLELIARRPDLISHLWMLEAYSREVDVAIVDFYPNVSIAALLGLDTINITNLFTPSSGYADLKPAFSLPVYTAHAIQSNVDAKTAEFMRAINNYNALVLESAKQVADTLAILKCVYMKYDSQKQIIQHADNVYGLVKWNYEKGLDNLLEVYKKQIVVIRKELENATLLYDQYMVITKLIKALGGGYYKDE